MRLILVVILSLPVPAAARVLFQETFDTGSNPFGFDLYHAPAPGTAYDGRLTAAPAPLGRAWQTEFHASGGGYFGHQLRFKPDWRLGDTLHWAAYVRFGFQDDSPEWRTAPGQPYELRLPVIGGNPDGLGRVMGRFLRWGEDPARGRFVLTTPDGYNHEVNDKLLVSNRWYLVQFALEDRGGRDRVRIWIDNANAARPDYDYVGGDMVDSAFWAPGLTVDQGYRAHPVDADTSVYYDSITLATDFIPLPVVGKAAPSAPGRLRVR